MNKLAKKLSRQILAIALSVAMIMPNMAVYASEVSDPDSVLPAGEVVEADDTSDGIDVEENIADDAQPSDAEDDLPGDEDETINAGEEEDLGEADESDALEDGDAAVDRDVQELEAEIPLMDQSARTIPTSWNFREGSELMGDNGTTIQGGEGTVNGLKIDATKGKFDTTRSDWVQVNAGTIIKVPVAGMSKVTIVVNGAPVEYTVDDIENESTIKTNTFVCAGTVDATDTSSKWVTIKWGGTNDYIGSINVDPITLDDTLEPASEVATTTNISFTSKFSSGPHSNGDAVSDIDEIAVKNITYHNNNGSHGIQTGTNAVMVVKIPEGKKADIAVLGCQSGKTAHMKGAVNSAGAGFRIIKVKSTEGYAVGAADAYEYNVIGAEGTVTLFFDGSMYIHNLKVVDFWAEGVTAKHAIKVTAGEHGKASANTPFAAENEDITLTLTPDDGFKPVIKLTDKDGTELNVTVGEDNKFQMPGKDVIVEVTFAAAGEPRTIDVTETVEHGRAEAKSKTEAAPKEIVDMDEVATAIPDTGYELQEWQVTYTEGGTTKNVDVKKTGKKYSFTMPDADITITPVFQVAVAKYFQTTYFNKQYTTGGHSKNDDVDDVDGLEVVNGRFIYNDSQHGLSVNGAEVKLTLTPSKKYDIVVWECSEGSGTLAATYNGETKDVPSVTANNSEDPVKQENGVKKFTITNVENEVTLKFSAGQAYVHSIILTESSGVPKYTVTVSGDENGTAQTDKAIAEADEDITLTAKPNLGFKLKEWNVVSPETNKPTITTDPGNVNVATFKMPASDVTIQAVFESTGENPADIQDKDGFYNGLLASEPIDGRKYYFDFSEPLIGAVEDKAHLPNTYEKGLFSYSKGNASSDAYFHSKNYGIEFAAYNTLTFQVSGDCSIVVGGDHNSNCTKLKATSETGTLKPDELSTYIQNGHGTLDNCKNQTGAVLTYEYTGEKGSVTFTLDEAGSKAYIVAVCIIPKKKADPSAPTYTYTFNPTSENIAADNYITPAGSKFVNDYFEIVDGDITGKNGKVELKNNAQSAVKFATKETSTVSILAESTSGSNKSNLVLYKYNSTDDKWDIVGEMKEVSGNTAVTITYENLEAGTYKVAVPSETHPHGRGVRISKIEVTEKLTPEMVTVNVDAPDDGTALTLVFTCRETQEVIRKPIENAKCVATLNALYTYDLMTEPTRYVITEGAELKLGAANETLTAVHDIKVEAVRLRTLSGAIKGLDEDSEALSKLKISFAKPADKIYVPNITIDRDNKTYTAELESDVEYTIITEGINDYELDYNASSNSDKIKITSDTAGRNITYAKKPVYKVTIAPRGATLDNLANATFTFTNLNEEGYVYDFTGTGNIELRDGTYSVKVSNSGIYVQQLTSNLIVDGAPVTKEISFNSDITEWDFSDPEWTADAAASNAYRGLELTSVSKNKTYALMGNGSVIKIPANKACNIIVTFCYQAAAAINGTAISTDSNNTGKHETVTYAYTGTGDVKITATGTTYIEKISMLEPVAYKDEITVGADGCDYTTINDALDAVRKMSRSADQAVTISIKPGDYEEMIVVDVANVTLKNASNTPSIGLRNKGVDIDPNAVRITSYYGVGYDYYSMDSNYKWNEEILENNKANGHATCSNPTGGGTACYWNATAVITASNVSVEGIIFENSFNQYISKKAAEDVLVKQGGAKEGDTPRASMAVGDTTVQKKEYVERAAALAIADGCTKVSFDNCKVIGRQDTLYGGTDSKVAFYNCAIYGATDYIMGPMTAVFAKCDLVFNTNDQTSKGKDDIGYITAAQQKSGRGYLMYNCHVTSTVPGVDTASEHTSKPGYFGRPWQAGTGEAVFYKTIIDEVDAYWQDSSNTDIKPELKGKSLIAPAGWNSSLQGESVLSQEYGTYEVSGVESNQYQELDADGNVTKAGRVKWSTLLTGETLKDGKPISVATFFDDWNPFNGKDMTIVLPDDQNVAAPAVPTAIVTPEPTKTGEGETAVKTVIKGATIVLSAEAGAKVYYNINADAEPEQNEESLYAGAIKVEGDNITADNTITIKAIAVKYGKPSDVATFTYTVTEAPETKVPVLPAEGDITLGSRIKISAEAGAEIYYNVNSEDAPTADSTLYTGKDGIEITTKLVSKTDSTVTIKAIAILNGKTSEVASATYGVIVNTPTANPKSGYQFPDGGGKVVLTADEDVTILYTMGSEPKDPRADDAEPKTYNKETGIPVSADTTIKAVAQRGNKYSDVVTLSYKVPLSMPTANPESGSELLPNERTVRLTADEGATIYYTTGTDVAFVADPSKADSGRETYDNGITVTAETTVIKAVAARGDQYSVVAVFTYTLSDTVTALTAKVNNSPVRNDATMTVDKDSDVTVKFETATKDALIYYTLDGTDPNTESAPYNKTTGVVISNISETTVIKAFATKTGMTSSNIFTVTLNVKTHGGNDTPPDGEGLRIVFNDGKVYTYTGTAIKPSITVWNNDDKLIEGTDYTVRYTNNIKASVTMTDNGWADIFDKSNKWPTITVTGKGNLSGKTSETFKIYPKNLEDAKDDATAANADDLAEIKAADVVVLPNRKAAPVLLYGGVKLAARDYKVTEVTGAIDNNIANPANAKWAEGASDATMTLTAIDKGNYTGEVKIKVIVATAAQQKAAKMKAVFKYVSDKTQYYKAESITPEIIVSNSDRDNPKSSAETEADKKLESGVDFVISYPADTTNVGTKKVMITGTSADCIGTVTLTYSIKPATIKQNASLEAVRNPEDAVYDYVSTGVTLGDDLTVNYKYEGETVDTTLVEGVDYKVTYTNNKKASTDTVRAAYVVTGLGNYKGLKTAKQYFTIKGLVLSNENKSENAGEGIQLIVADKIYKNKAVYKSVPSLIVNGELVKTSEYTVKYRLDETAEWSTRLDKIELGEGEDSKTVYVKIEPKPNKVNYIYEDGKELTTSYKVVRTTTKKDLSTARITLQDESGKAAKVAYTGNEVTPYKALIKIKGLDNDITIILDGEGANYEAQGFKVTYANNVLKGKATVVIEATDSNDKVVGSKSATFNIVQKNLLTGLKADEGFQEYVANFFKSLFDN